MALNILSRFKTKFQICFPNDSASLRFTVWMKGPSAGRVFVVGHDGRAVTPCGSRQEPREQMGDIIPEVKNQPEEVGDASLMQAHLSKSLKT